jgi:hypothetical protein
MIRAAQALLLLEHIAYSPLMFKRGHSQRFFSEIQDNFQLIFRINR